MLSKRRQRAALVPGIALGLLVALSVLVLHPAELPDQTDSTSPAAYHPRTGTFWMTSPVDPKRRLIVQPESTATATAWVRVDPSQAHQKWWGSGAAVTDASVELLGDRPNLVRQLFHPAAAKGARLDLLRLPLSATDFSPQQWSWRWDGTTAKPTKRARAALDLVRRALARSDDRLRVIASPWSAPPRLKNTRTLRGGSLEPGAVADYGRMLVSQARWLKTHDVPLLALTLGNEPGYATDYGSMTIGDLELAALAAKVGPALDRLRVKLLALDHNWSDRDRADRLLLATPAAYDGVAFHCYGGNPGQSAGLPVPHLVTECTGTDDGWASTFAWDAANLVSRPVAAGSTGLLMWNLALDENHGPVDTGSVHGCKTCRGLLTVTPAGVGREPEFYTLAHVARAARRGDRVVDVAGSEGLRLAAFRASDGSVGVFGHNGTGTAQVVDFEIPGRGSARFEVDAGALFTLRK